MDDWIAQVHEYGQGHLVDHWGRLSAEKRTQLANQIQSIDFNEIAKLFAADEKKFPAGDYVDMHTHLYPPTFGTPVPNRSGETDVSGLLLWGIDELLTYHYLVAEVFRIVPASQLPYEQFWKLSKQQQADHIWKHLFVERTPISEACRGVLTTIQKLGFDPADKDLSKWRKWTAQQDPGEYIDRVMQISNVASITMTNAVFDDNERERWLKNPDVASDSRFATVLRIDPLLRSFPSEPPRWHRGVTTSLRRSTTRP